MLASGPGDRDSILGRVFCLVVVQSCRSGVSSETRTHQEMFAGLACVTPPEALIGKITEGICSITPLWLVESFVINGQQLLSYLRRIFRFFFAFLSLAVQPR